MKFKGLWVNPDHEEDQFQLTHKSSDYYYMKYEMDGKSYKEEVGIYIGSPDSSGNNAALLTENGKLGRTQIGFNSNNLNVLEINGRYYLRREG